MGWPGVLDATVVPEVTGPARSPNRSRWVLLSSYIAVVSVSHILWISFASISTEAGRAFHTTDVSIGLLVSVGPICSALFSVPAGLIPDRYGYRIPLLSAGTATVVFAAMRPLAHSFPLLLVLTVGMLIPQPFLINAVADVVNRHFIEDEAATATGLGTMAIFLGITIGVAATPGLVDLVGVRGSQLVYAGLAAAALFAFWSVSPRRVPDRLVAPEELPAREAFTRAVRSRTLWKLAAILFCGFGFYLGLTTWLADIVKPKGITESSAGLVTGTITLAGIAGSVALGALSDHVRRRKPFLVVAGVVSIPSVYLLGHLGSLGALVPVAFLLGFFLLAALPVSIAIVSEEPALGPQVASTGVGVILMAGNLGGAAVVALMGILKDAQGGFGGAIVLACALAVVASSVAMTLDDPLATTGSLAIPQHGN